MVTLITRNLLPGKKQKEIANSPVESNFVQTF